MQSMRIPILAGALALGACSQSSTSPPGGPALEIAVAPLELPLMSDACYELTVWNRSDPDADGAEVVWTQPSLCASQYGGDGGIRFTGICDASAPDGHNAIRLVLNDVYTNGDAPDGDTLTAGSDYINPCPAPTEDSEDNGCVLTAPCDQNQDSRITFDLTVMRQAELGFFDTVVKFQDVFCAAKLDCVDQNDAPLTYLYNPSTHADGPTAVLGFTCLGGSGGDVFMYLDDLVVTCGNQTSTVDPSDGPGLVDHAESNGASPILFAASVNTGAGFQGAKYWNVLLGLNPRPGETCTLTTRGTVSETALTGSPFETKPHTRYPYIDWDVTLSDGTNGGALTCTRQPLNGGNGVATEYTPIDEPQTFARTLALQATCPCWDVATLASQVLALASAPGAQTELSSNESSGFGYQSVSVSADEDYLNAYVWYSGSGTSVEMTCVYNGSSFTGTQIGGLTPEVYDACAADLAVAVDDPCQRDNGGCTGATPGCVFDAPGIRHCVECLTNEQCVGNPHGETCDSDTSSASYFGAPTNTCTHCAAPDFACPTGQWCDIDGSCKSPGQWFAVPFAESRNFAANTEAESACAAQSKHFVSARELVAALNAQANGTSISGVAFSADWTYGAEAASDPTWSVPAWGYSGSGAQGPWNNSFGNAALVVCAP